MPYCKTTFHTIYPKHIKHMLSSFAAEHFVGGMGAFDLGDGSFSIDAGENDIRALYDDENAIVKFFCRYERDIGRYDKKLIAFAQKHEIEYHDDNTA